MYKVSANSHLLMERKKINEARIFVENFLKEVSELAVNVGASRVWFKPMEIHIESHAPYIPVKESMRELSLSLRDAIKYAEDNGLLVFQKDYCEEIIRRYSGDTFNV